MTDDPENKDGQAGSDADEGKKKKPGLMAEAEAVGEKLAALVSGHHGDEAGSAEGTEGADLASSEPEELTDDHFAAHAEMGTNEDDPASDLDPDLAGCLAESTAMMGADPETPQTDVALASLCQSYAHALSIAFHDAVQAQQRRSALGQAAVARAIEQIQQTDPKDFEERLSQLAKGLDALGASASSNMAAFTELTQQFNAAAEQLLMVREKAGIKP